MLYRARIHPLFYIRIWVLFAIMTAAACWLAYAYRGQIGVLTSIILFAASRHFLLKLDCALMDARDRSDKFAGSKETGLLSPAHP